MRAAFASDQNQLLAALPDSDRAVLLPHLQLVDLPLGKVLYESGSVMSYLYFPTSSLVSLLHLMEDGASTEIAFVGNEGVVGVALFLGGQSTTGHAVVQSAGAAYRLKSDVLMQRFNLGGAVANSLLRYTQALLTQMAQIAVCNRQHTIDQQLCRCLLLSMDRLSSNELVMTQDQIANRLGVRREGVTAAAGRLEKAGIISYSRGRITVIERSALESDVCECYSVVKAEYDRLLR